MRPGRPEYRPGAATNQVFKLRYGYRLSDRWLLSGSLSYELLDDTIVDSPIVGRDALWAGSVGLAYDADIFQPRDYPYDGSRDAAVEFRIGAFFDTASTKVTRNSEAGIPGTPVVVEDLLGLDDDGVVAQADLFIRIADFHRVEMSYFEFNRKGGIALEDAISFGELDLDAGTVVSSREDIAVFRLGYTYSLMKDAQKELGVMVGLHYSDIRVAITTEDGRREASNTTVPLPVIGLNGSASLTSKWMARAQVGAFAQDFDNYDGVLLSGTFEVLRKLGDGFTVGLGLNYYRLDLTSNNDQLAGDILNEHFGPVLLLSARF